MRFGKLEAISSFHSRYSSFRNIFVSNQRIHYLLFSLSDIWMAKDASLKYWKGNVKMHF